MQTKKLSRAISVMFALALVVMLPLFFAGCDISKADVAKNAKAAATAYFDANQSYAKFGDATFSSSQTTTNVNVFTEEGGLAIKKETVTTTVKDSTLSLKGSSNLVSAKLVYVETVTVQENNLTAKTKGTPTVTKTTSVYNFNKAIIGTEAKYYVTELQTVEETGQDVRTTIKQIEELDQDYYEEVLTEIVAGMNGNMEEAFSSVSPATLGMLSMFTGADFKCEKSGDTTKISGQYSSFDIVNNKVYDENADFAISFSNKGYNYSVNSTNTTDGSDEVNKLSFTYKNTAETAQIVNYTETVGDLDPAAVIAQRVPRFENINPMM